MNILWRTYMDDLKLNEGFQVLSDSEAESLEGGWFFGRMASGVADITNGAFNRTVGALETVDRGIATVLNTPANLIRLIFRV